MRPSEAQPAPPLKFWTIFDHFYSSYGRYKAQMLHNFEKLEKINVFLPSKNLIYPSGWATETKSFEDQLEGWLSLGKKLGEFWLRSTAKSAPDGGQTDEIYSIFLIFFSLSLGVVILLLKIFLSSASDYCTYWSISFSMNSRGKNHP